MLYPRNLAVTLTGMLLLPGLALAETSSGALQYNRDIRPIISENCFTCHGADSAARKASLRLDRFDDAIAPRKDSNPAIVPGKPGESALVKRIFADDPDDVMPPPKTHKVLTTQQKQTLKQWIAEGAKYEAHWSLIAPKRGEMPAVKNARWVRNPIDSFILARLEREGLEPNSEADRRTLLRRVSLDLTGLPPTPAEISAFLADRSPDAYEKQVDRLLASPHWGEHRARYWLDAARYADTHGIHIDDYREIWPYRDWVINALNRNEPFDQFTIEQLAGDLLPNPTLDQKVASGFNRCNITTSEGGAIDDEYYVLYARDRTDTTSQVFLGLTAGCAVCHDHKYDRLTQKEFYALSAFFNNTTQKAMDGNVKDTPPVIFVPAKEDRAKWDRLASDRAKAKSKLEARKKAAKPDFDQWLTQADGTLFTKDGPKDQPAVFASLSEGQGSSLKFTVNGQERQLEAGTNASWEEGVLAEKAFKSSSKTTPELAEAGDFEQDKAFSYAVWVRLSDGRDGSAFARMDDKNDFRGWDLWFENGKPGTHIVNKWPENALKVVANQPLEPNRWSHVCVTYDGSKKAAGVRIYVDGRKQEVGVQADKLNGTIKTEVPFKLGQRRTTSPLERAGLQDLRLYNRALDESEIKALGSGARLQWLLAKSPEHRTEQERDDLFKGWLNLVDKPYQMALSAVAQIDKQEAEIKTRGAITHVMQEKPEPPFAYVLFRGEYTQKRDKVTPTTPAALPPMAAELPRNRLGLAKWITNPENPLMARVTVNRFWQEVFGTGIVKTVGDLGISGEMPSHQELLDWMAVDFRESGWDVKKFFKLLVTSATYRQSAVVTPEKLAKDPQNRLLSRGPRFRMDAEMVRDLALEASGLLVPKLGGPSVRPYQPDGVWEAIAMKESNTGSYKRDTGEGLYRRSLYTFWKRQAPPATMEIFNAPNRETCTVKRERSDTPLQALAALNDEQFVEAARHLAELSLKAECSGEDARIDFMAERMLGRPLRPEEKRIAEANLKDLLAYYSQAPKESIELLTVGEQKPDPSLPAPKLAAYAMLANELMNLDEVLNK
jgi:hypothetical protein